MFHGGYFRVELSTDTHYAGEFFVFFFDEFGEEADSGVGVGGEGTEHGGENAEDMFGGVAFVL